VVDWDGLRRRRLVDSQGCCSYAGVARSFPNSATSRHEEKNLHTGIRSNFAQDASSKTLMMLTGAKAWERFRGERAAWDITYRGHAWEKGLRVFEGDTGEG
jgi:hypothetical protein